MSIFESIFNKDKDGDKPSGIKKPEETNPYKRNFNRDMESRKKESVERLKQNYEMLLERAIDVGLSREDMEDILLSQIEQGGISDSAKFQLDKHGLRFIKNISDILEKFGNSKLKEKIKERIGLNFHLGESIYPYVDKKSYPNVEHISSETIFLLYEAGLIKVEEKYGEDYIGEIIVKAKQEFIIFNINPDIVKSTQEEITKIAPSIKEARLKSDIINSDQVFNNTNSSDEEVEFSKSI